MYGSAVDFVALIVGIELMHRICKGRFDVCSNIKEIAAPAIWNAVLSA
jgi:hypothetical protein